MADKLKLEVLLKAIDQATGPLKRVMAGSQGLSRAVKQARDSLKELNKVQGDIDTFKKLSKDAAIAGNQLKTAQEKVKALKQAMEQAGTPTKAMQKELAAATKAADQLKQKSQGLADAVAASKGRLEAAGVSTRNLKLEQGELAGKIAQAEAALKREEAALAKVNARMKAMSAAKAQLDKAMETRSKLQGAGLGLSAGGAATGALVMRPIIDFAQAEDSAAQLKAAMMGAGGAIRPEFAEINALAERLGNRLPGTTAELTDMMTMLMRQGMSAKSVLGGVGEATAYLAAQLKMPYQDAAEFSAKLQDATRTTEKDMMGLMDAIQRTFYLGVDSNNMLEGFAKITPALGIIKKEGLDAAKMMAPFLVMLDQAGMRGEAAGNALRKVFQASMNADDKVTKANKALAGQGVKLDFTNKKGEFGGLDKLFAELAKLQKLNTQDRLGTIKTIFGDDAEVLQTVALIIDKGKAEYQEVQAKMAAQASLQERVNLQLGTLKNLWEAATGTFTNALVAVGESVAPEVRAITVWLGDVAAKAQAWAKANPALAAGLMKTGAALAVILAVLGILTTTLAMVLGPLAIVRYGFAMFGIQLGRFGLVGPLVSGAIRGIGGALGWVLRLLVANPIGAAAALLAMGAIYIWRNWGTLGPKFAALWAGIKNAMVGAWAGITGYLSGLGGQMMAIGGQIIEGLKQGILSRVAAVREAISGVAASIASAAKGALGIKSPSRVFAEIGDHTMQGLHHGIVGGQSGPLGAMQQLTRQLAGVGMGIALNTPPALAAPVAFDTRPPIRRAAAGGGGMVVNITINAAPGQDEAEIARQVQLALARAESEKAARGRSRLSDRD